MFPDNPRARHRTTHLIVNFEFTTCEYIDHQTGLGTRPVTDGSTGNPPIHPLTFSLEVPTLFLRTATVVPFELLQHFSLWIKSSSTCLFFHENGVVLVAPTLSKTNLLFQLNKIYHMRIHRPPERFGLPPNYRWIYGHPHGLIVSSQSISSHLPNFVDTRMYPNPLIKQQS